MLLDENTDHASFLFINLSDKYKKKIVFIIYVQYFYHG